MADAPPLPPGFELEDNPKKKPKGRKTRLDNYTPSGDVRDLGGEYRPTGGVVDGDTVRLEPTNGKPTPNGRVLGYDAWESGQFGYRPGRGPVAIGQQSTGALDDLVTPATAVFGIGRETYGRPVVSLNNDGTDPVTSLLMGGNGLAAPEYLANDPARRANYMEAERLGRLNAQGGHATQTMTPEAYRRADRWNLKLRPDEEVQFTSDLPDFRPEFKRLTNDQEQDFYAFLARNSGNPNFSQADLDGYWKERGFVGSAPADSKFIESIRKGEKVGPVDYSAWDAQTLRDFNMANAFAGMRPEVQQEYNTLLQSKDVTPDAIEKWGQAYGMSFDPRDLRDFVDQKAKGGNPNIPIPIINPGDGAGGAAGRGFIDTLGFAGEVGGAIDAVAPEWMQSAAQDITGGSEGFKHRETIWNSDRSLSDIWRNNWRQNEAILNYDETRHPFARLGGQLVGGVFIPGSAGVRGAAGFAKAGAIEGGIYGFGSGDGGLGTRLANVPLNALGGAVGGAAIGKGIDLAAPLVGKVAGRLAGRSGEAVAEDLPPLPEGFQMERADMAAEPMPALSGPRVRDTIDVNSARPRPMIDGPSPDLMQAATARVEPQDVLPRPSNELTPEEAAQLGAGPYRDVPAPRERDYLEAQQYPSARNPDVMVNRRGPADLVTFARAQGGLRDEGGELAASGITNAPRKGEDFTGGENRLGRLVDQERGLSVEDMAQKAYNEGYFPELDRPPTNQEFLAALDDTYRGVGRRFRPEDEGQIQAFEGARDQRLAVERARQEGAPLAQDVGQPATYEDAVANAAPPVNPDDWDAATLTKVGNVRVDKLDTPQEISQALKVANDITGGFEASRRGRITQAETEALASDLGMTADDLLARRKGQAFNAEEALAARRILAASGNELVNLARRVQRAGDEPGSELLAAFRKAMVRHTAIQEQVAGATAEAGRALSQFRMAANSREVPGRVLEGLVNAGGGPTRLKDAADAILTLEKDPASLNHFVEKAAKPKFSDKVVELWYNFLLSGPQTHAVNVLSNTMTSLAQIPEYGAASLIGQARRLSPIARKNVEDRVTFTEIGQRVVGLLQGTREGMREAAFAFRTGESRDFVTKVEAQGQKAISGTKGEVLRLPTRALTAEDELFKAMARRMELSGLAVRKARSEGLNGEAGRKRAAELLANPTDDMWESAMDYGRYVTFQRPLGEVASKVSAITQAAPILKAVLPFVRTPTNLFKFAVERSPAAPVLKEWRKDFAAGGARRDIAVARAMVGTGMGALMAELAAKGILTGSPPADENKRRLLYADGWQPYSVKIGDRYYSYKRLDPFALTIGAAADIATLSNGMTDNQRSKGAALVVASIMGNLSNKTWLSGLADVLAAADDPERFGDSFIKRFAGSLAVPTGVAQIARTVDPTLRETPDTTSYIQSRVPGLSGKLLPKRDVWGRPIETEGGIGPDIISPIWTSTAKADPATWEALRVDATISAPSDRVNGKKLDTKVYDRLQAVTGPLAHKWVSELIAKPEYRSLDMDGQAKAIKFVMEKAREAAKANVLGGVPNPANRPERGQRKPSSRRARPALPPGFQIEPLPTGFVLDR
ncbi:thermonuclease family protein [Sphingopyxis sp. GC21]|uniref:thermonuclease family protein n=1 Tax=Sphingopyxis sp. GC21 TaxID=2933562 RepID=UPI0021E3A7F3|nr:hypothetical protein [Sphingopyxis sp. GC21]